MRQRPVPHVGAPLPEARKKFSADRLYRKLLEVVPKILIAMIVMVLAFKGIVRLMDSRKVPFLKVSRDVMQGDGEFTLPTEYGFVREAYKPDGAKMSQEELKKLAEQPNPECNIELVDPNYPSQW